jgi:hypothetical protein
VNDDNATLRTVFAPLEEIADRYGLEPDLVRGAVDAGEIRQHRRPDDSRTFLAEREVLVWLGARKHLAP